MSRRAVLIQHMNSLPDKDRQSCCDMRSISSSLTRSFRDLLPKNKLRTRDKISVLRRGAPSFPSRSMTDMSGRPTDATRFKPEARSESKPVKLSCRYLPRLRPCFSLLRLLGLLIATLSSDFGPSPKDLGGCCNAAMLLKVARAGLSRPPTPGPPFTISTWPM